MEKVSQSASPDSHGTSSEELKEAAIRFLREIGFEDIPGYDDLEVLCVLPITEPASNYHNPEGSCFQLGEVPQFLLDTEFDIENGLSDAIPADILSLLEPY